MTDFAAALAAHHNGEFAHAEATYRQILSQPHRKPLVSAPVSSTQP
jgi:hypothetical protein